MAVQFEDADDAPKEPASMSNNARSTRWATQRVGGDSGIRKRVSILNRFHRRSALHEKRKSAASIASSSKSNPKTPTAANAVGTDEQEKGEPRSIYCNIPLPEHMLNDEGHPRTEYVRNKVRTAKYTPLSFVPKNLYLQFQNVANIYFLIIVILNCFPIFGSNNAGLNAVPLIAILAVTAIKDAIEDWRRTMIDNELNNSPVHRLVDWKNVNASSDSISLWRRFKKLCTRSIVSTYRWTKSVIHKSRNPSHQEQGSHRGTPTDAGNRNSINPSRGSYESADADQEAIQMAPVSPPNPDFSKQPGLAVPGSSSTGKKGPQRDYGSILNKWKPSPNTARFAKDVWKNIQVGDFIRIYSDEAVPADIAIVSTSDPDGCCYVETKSLDGETNLKVRQALRCGQSVKHARDCERTEFVIDSEPPHANLYQYNGAIKWSQFDRHDPDAPPYERVEPLTINNMLLRGCNLRNTEWVLGIVIFTGLETKIMLNSGETPRKRPNLAKNLNWNVLYNFIILFCMCFIAGVVEGTTWASPNQSLDYFEYDTTPAPVSGIIDFVSAVILFQNLVPISLYITLEIIRTFQAIFIHVDRFMYYEPLNYACTPKSWNISDDIGQIEYIFSDKTGTLTQNVMEFKKCTINGVTYGEAYTEALAGMQRREGIDVETVGRQTKAKIANTKTEMLRQLRAIHDNPYLDDDQITFVSSDFVSDLSGASGPLQADAVEYFMVALALCHTVVTNRTPGDPPSIEFKAQSPDEAALVSTARDCGFTVLGRSGDDVRVNVMGEDRIYTVLNILEFNSSRKRMSVIVRMPDGRIVMFCKGADSIIYSRLAKGQQAELRRTTSDHLETFAREGLRTLCIAHRELSEEEYNIWSRSHDEAAAAMSDRELRLEEVSSAIEQELSLIGGTAIEDRLQDGVPDTISMLGGAGIKLWVLTGDKVETAINIGFSCNLLANDMELIVFDVHGNDMKACEDQLDKHLARFDLTGSDEELAAARRNHEPPPPTHALVVDGDSLKLLLHDETKQRFLILAKQCKAVLCCRVSPAQKAAVVALVRGGLDVMALSIGDGANDVAMIQQADVGVGIVGEEGTQAAMSSDYAIGQFRFLQRLILVHGRWCYRRMGESMANFFYKSLVWTFGLFWYSIYNSFDGSFLYDYTYIVLINLAFTSLPVIFQGIFDQDVDDKVSLAVPQLFKRGIERAEWSQTKFWLYMLDGFYQSVISFYMAYLIFYTGVPARRDGLDISDRPRMGVFVGCNAVLASNMYILLNTYRWDWFTVLIDSIGTLLIWFWTGVYSSSPASNQFYKSAAQVFGSLEFWADLLLSFVMCMAPRFAIKSYHKVFRPLDVDIIREQVRMGRFKYLDNYDAYVPPNGSDSSSTVKEVEQIVKQDNGIPEDERPFYASSIAPTAGTHNPRSTNGSGGTGYTSLEHNVPRSQSIEPARDPEVAIQYRSSSGEDSNPFVNPQD